MSLHRFRGLLLVGALLLFAGCDPAALNPNRGKIELVKNGMDYQQVVNLIGAPDAVIRGEGVQVNWKELVYPHGSVFLYRMQVQKVLRRKFDRVKPKDDEDMLSPYRERNIFEETPGAGSGRRSR